MRRKQLNGVAASIAHKFASSAEHFAYLAWAHKTKTVDIDLLTLKIAPAIFNIDRNLNLVRFCQKNLFELIDKSELTQAKLNIIFEIAITQSKPLSIAVAVFQVQLIDASRKVAEYSYTQSEQHIAP